MEKIIVANNQSLQDVALRYMGSIEAVYDIALLNGISPTQFIKSGSKLMMPKAFEVDKKTVDYFEANDLESATAIKAPRFTEAENPNTLFAPGLFEPGLFK